LKNNYLFVKINKKNSYPKNLKQNKLEKIISKFKKKGKTIFIKLKKKTNEKHTF